MRTRTIALAAAALLAGGGSTLAMAPAALAAGTGSGTYGCQAGSGKVTYSPALTDAGGPTTVNLKFSASTCTGGTPTPTKVHGTWTQTIDLPVHACSEFTSPVAITGLKLTYYPHVSPSTVSGGGVTVSGPEILFSNFDVSGSYPVTHSGTIELQTFVPQHGGNCTSGIASAKVSNAANPMDDV